MYLEPDQAKVTPARLQNGRTAQPAVPWAGEGEHVLAVSEPVPGLEVVRWTVDHVTKLFEGPYESAPMWERQFEADLERQGQNVDAVYFFYTICPKCVEVYGKNHIVAVAKLAEKSSGTTKAS